MAVDKCEVFRRVLTEGLFIMLPVIAIVIIENLNEYVAPSIHDSGLFIELTLAIMIFFADTLRDAAKEEVTWKKWKMLKFVGFYVPIVGLLVVGNFLTVHSPKYKPFIVLLAVGAFLLWCAVKIRVVYMEISLRNFRLENIRLRPRPKAQE
jgi:hypothetical protein